MKLKTTISGTEKTVSVLWCQHDTNDPPPDKPTKYPASDDDPPSQWSRHPILARGNYVFMAVAIDDGDFGTPVICGVAIDPA